MERYTIPKQAKIVTLFFKNNQSIINRTHSEHLKDFIA